MGFDNWLLAFDETLTRVLGDWDIYSTSIAAVLLVFFAYQVFSRRDPDTHPMLLARQAQASPIRHPGESAVYRSHSSPHGMELNSGLNVRDPGSNKWARGRDGDLRDVWRRIALGAVNKDGQPTGEKGRILTVLGASQIVEHKLDDLSREINIIGQYIRQQSGQRVAIYLPNSVELLETLFACAFYEASPILLPYNQPPKTIISMLKQAGADTLVAAVGSIPFDAIVQDYPNLRQLIWVVDEGSRHMDWNEVPNGTGGSINVSTWQEIVEDQQSASAELPPVNPQSTPKSVCAFWQTKSGDVGQLVEYTQSNLVSAISAQINAIPAAQRVGLSDLVFPADSLSTLYTLVVTLAAVYYNASLVLNSVSGPDTDLVLSTQRIAPTIIVASPSTLAKTHKETAAKLGSSFLRFVHWLQTRTLTQDGVMPLASLLTRYNDSKRPAIGNTPGKLRLIFVAEKVNGESPPLNSYDLSDLRIFTGARVVYALTAAKVAGAVTQTAYYDYRVDESKRAHFGAPVSSVEIVLKDTPEKKTTDDLAVGEVVARGPAVVGGNAALGVVGIIREDHTLAYA